MIQLSKKIIFLLIVICALITAISYYFIDWEIFEISISDAVKEIRLTVVSFLLGITFIFSYVKKLKQ